MISNIHLIIPTIYNKSLLLNRVNTLLLEPINHGQKLTYQKNELNHEFSKMQQ